MTDTISRIVDYFAPWRKDNLNIFVHGNMMVTSSSFYRQKDEFPLI